MASRSMSYCISSIQHQTFSASWGSIPRVSPTGISPNYMKSALASGIFHTVGFCLHSRWASRREKKSSAHRQGGSRVIRMGSGEAGVPGRISLGRASSGFLSHNLHRVGTGRASCTVGGSPSSLGTPDRCHLLGQLADCPQTTEVSRQETSV